MSELFKYKKYVEKYPFLQQLWGKLNANVIYGTKSVNEYFLNSYLEKSWIRGENGLLEIDEDLYGVFDGKVEEIKVNLRIHSARNYVRNYHESYDGTPIWEHLYINNLYPEYLIYIKSRYSCWRSEIDHRQTCTIFRCTDIQKIVKRIADRESEKIDWELSDKKIEDENKKT